DLFGTRGEMPRDLPEVEQRRKDISYSSRTRLNTDNYHQKHILRRAIADLYQHLPSDLKQRPEIQALRAYGEHHAVSIVHLIYRRKNYENRAHQCGNIGRQVSMTPVAPSATNRGRKCQRKASRCSISCMSLEVGATNSLGGSI